MGWPTELILGFGRIVASEVGETFKSVLVSMRLLESSLEDDEAETSTEEPLYGQLGAYARPDPEVASTAATGIRPEGYVEAIVYRQDDRAYPVACRDLRLSSQVNPDEGECGLVQYGGGFVSLKWNTDEDGTSIMIYAPRKLPSGTVTKASCISLDSTDGNQHVSIMAETGQSITLNKDDQIILAGVSGSNWMSLDDTDGLVVSAEKCAIAAATMLGNKDPAVGDEVMLSTKTLLWISQVNTFLGVLAGLHNAPPAPMVSGGPGTVVPPTSVPAAATKVKAI